MLFRNLKIFLVLALALAGVATVAEAQQGRGNSQRAPQRKADVILRCTYWSRGADAKKDVKLFIKQGREYKPFQVSEMAFIRAYEYNGPVPIPIFRKATEAEIAQREAEGVKKSEREYIQHALIDTKGIRDVGVLIQGDIASSRAVVFDLSEKSFPLGAVRIVNMSGLRLSGQFSDAEANKKETFQVSAESPFHTTQGTKTRVIKDLMLAVVDPKLPKGSQIVFSSSAAYRPESRSILFVAKSTAPQKPGKAPALEIRQISVYPLPPEPANKEDAGGNDSRDNRKGNKPEGKNKKAEKPKRELRRV